MRIIIHRAVVIQYNMIDQPSLQAQVALKKSLQDRGVTLATTKQHTDDSGITSVLQECKG